MGHATKDCKEERMTIEESVLKCFNCDEEGHRTRDCKATRVDRYACRNCKSVHTVCNFYLEPNLMDSKAIWSQCR